MISCFDMKPKKQKSDKKSLPVVQETHSKPIHVSRTTVKRCNTTVVHFVSNAASGDAPPLQRNMPVASPSIWERLWKRRTLPGETTVAYNLRY